MKRSLVLYIISIFSLPGLTNARDLPGIVIQDRSLFVPARYVSGFFACIEPDSARIVFTYDLPELQDVPDTASLLYRTVKIYKSLRTGGKEQDYHLLLNNLTSLNKSYYFRLFYKGASNRVYKIREHKTSGQLLRELVLLDHLTRMIEESIYYQSGNLLTRTQYKLRDTTTTSLQRWHVSAKMKEGKKMSFYNDGKLKTVQYYQQNKLQDTSYTYNRVGEIMYQELWKNDSLIARFVNDKLPGGGVTLNKKPADPRLKAFLVGVDKYSYKNVVVENGRTDTTAQIIYDLSGCVNDIELIGSVLKDHRGFLPPNVTMLRDDDATRENLLIEMEKLIAKLKKGDIVFLHFSGSGRTVSKIGDSGTGKEFAFACRDANKARFTWGHNGYLRRSEFEKIFDRIRKVVGQSGQMIISMDACETGSLADMNKKDSSGKLDGQKALRGESSDILFNFLGNKNASTALITATTGTEFSWELSADNGKTHGIYSYYLADALQGPSIATSRELFDEVVSLMQEYNSRKYGEGVLMRQNPGYFATNDFPLFEAEVTDEQSAAVLPEVKLSGNAYILSVGISQYQVQPANSRLKFNNCVNDARSYAAYFASQFDQTEAQKKLHPYLLTDTTATYKNIMNAINEIIFNSKPDDYFIFNFSGYCRQLTDSTGKRVTYFVPYGLKNIADTNEIKTRGKGIPLSQLKDLLQLIPANNQLFITEAGSTTAFQKEFIQALIESSPTIAALSNKNRVFMVPRSSGMDKFYCSNVAVEHGPLNYYVTNLDEELNIYGVFQGGIYSDAVKYAINKTEINCDYFRTGYFDIFFEREYIKDLQHFLPEELSQSRGFRANTEAKAALAVGNSKRYAMVVGTDKYLGKPDWNDLRNPVLDAKDIAAELESGFGYKVKLLLDAPMDSIYAHISWLSQMLKKNDQLIIYFAGHGDFDSTLLDDGFIVCRDSKPISMDPYRNSYIQYSKFSRMVNRLPASQILMALDVCFGGTFDERVARNQSRERTTDYDNLSNNTFLAEKLKKKTRLYLTSGGKDVVPDGLDKKHSPFALRLLQALQGRGGVSKLLTAKNLHQFVERLPSGPLLGSFGDDEVGSEFILLGN